MRRSGGKGDKLSDPVPRSVLVILMISLAYTYLVIYIGAFVRHTDSAGGCYGWPLCNGEFVPDLTGATLYVFIHRLAAVVLFVLTVYMWLHIRRVCGVPELRKSAALALILVSCQILSGALLTSTLNNPDWLVFTSILHNMIISGFFAILADMMIRSWKRREGREKA